MVMASTTVRAQAPAGNGPALAAEPTVQRALGWLESNAAWTTEQQIRINETAAPPFQEAVRGALMKRLLEGNGLRLRTDEIGNIIGERHGADTRNVVIVSAHLDTVFSRRTNVTVRRESGPNGRDGERLIGAGISDNAVGLSALLALARAFHEARIKTDLTVVFIANVGEEGEGNLRGMRKLMETYKGRIRAVIAIDGASTDHITAKALASKRFEVTVSGPGGHSWSDFGQPNPIHALARGVARFVRVRVPSEPRTTFNVGEVSGGTSVNSIPYSASVKVDTRSTADGEIEKLEAALREAIQAGVDEENNTARERNGRNGRLVAQFKVLGVRPGGELPANSPLLEAVRNADRVLNNRSRIERSSTDANIPLSLGIPALSLGAGGRGGGSHSLEEWYEPAGRELGLKRILLTVLGVAGVRK
jgi:acetylornithine deacetylase/succinyl-diaminopimelate desuccinylase-like protein